VPSKKKTKKKSTSKKVAKKKTAKKVAVVKKTTKKKTAKKVTGKKITKKKVAKKKVAKKAAMAKKTVTKKVAKKKTVSKKVAAKKIATPTGTKKKSAKKTATKKITKKKVAKKSKGKTVTITETVTSAVPRKIKFGQPAAKAHKVGVIKAAKLVGVSQYQATVTIKSLPIKELQKKKSGLSAKDLQKYEILLRQKRAMITGDVQSLNDDARGKGGNLSNIPLHMADVGSDNYEQEFTLGLMETESRMLLRINEAIGRIKDKYYGVCMETGKPIGKARLDAKPWAKWCIEVAREKDKQGLLD